MAAINPDALFSAHLKLAAKIGNRFPIPGFSIDEGIQEARIALWKAANEFDPSRGDFEGFASIVIRNHLRNVFDRAKRTTVEATTLDNIVVNETEETSEKENIPSNDADPLLEAERADIRKAIKQSLDALTPPQKELLERFAAGESYADIGREKGVSPAAIRQMALRALGQVRPNLEARTIGVRFMPMRQADNETPNEIGFRFWGANKPTHTPHTSASGCSVSILLLSGFGILVHFIQAALNARH